MAEFISSISSKVSKTSARGVDTAMANNGFRLEKIRSVCLSPPDATKVWKQNHKYPDVGTFL